MQLFLGFWGELKKPFFVLAPMANVTDVVFRRVIAKHGKPDVTWTEFVAADGLCHPKGRQALLRDLMYTEGERPVVTQLFTAHPEKMFEAAKFVAELGFDGIDINMGCPDKNVMKQGAGATLMKDPALAQAIIRAAQDGAAASGNVVPISVKTRLGFNEDELETWLPAILEAHPAVVTVHARTKKEMSKVPADWERVKRAVEIAAGSGTLIIGNGDVRDLADAAAKVRETGCDGVMLGRAVFGNPWLFVDVARARRGCHSEHPASSEPFLNPQDHDFGRVSETVAAQSRNRPNPSVDGECAAVRKSGEDGAGWTRVTVREKLEAAVEHTKLFEEVWENTKSFELMKKHYQAYVNHFPLAKELRVELMGCRSAAEVDQIVGAFLISHSDIAACAVGEAD